MKCFNVDHSSGDVDIGISAVCYRTGEAEKKTILRNTISDEILYEKVQRIKIFTSKDVADRTIW